VCQAVQSMLIPMFECWTVLVLVESLCAHLMPDLQSTLRCWLDRATTPTLIFIHASSFKDPKEHHLPVDVHDCVCDLSMSRSSLYQRDTNLTLNTRSYYLTRPEVGKR
jgi:hypothetical protein